jgi:hypothetical protein
VGGDSPDDTTDAAPACATDVWRAVGRASIDELAAAIGAPLELGPPDRGRRPVRGHGDYYHFACLTCSGKAGAVSASRWQCYDQACRRSGTIAELARVVAETPDALDALVRPRDREAVAA